MGAGVMLLAIAGTLDGRASTLSQTFNDPSVTTGDQFGSSVATHAGKVLVGARLDDSNGGDVGQAHLFDAATGNLLQTFNDPTASFFGDEFGASVAMDGDNVLIGAPLDDTNGTNVGQAHLFDAATGNLLQTFNNPTAAPGDGFGFSVAIVGGNVVIGAPGDDTNGTNVGRAHMFDAHTGNLLKTFDDPTVTSADQFGFSVAIESGNVLIGAPLDDTNGIAVGQAHLFDVATGNLLQTFNDPTVSVFGDHFGFSVAIEGGNALVGAPVDGTNGTQVGQAHLFDASTGNLLKTFKDPSITSFDNFGHSVAIEGGNVLIGVPTDDTKGTNVGQAHLFDATTGNLLKTFNDPGATSFNRFGTSVAIDGGNFLIGAPLDDTNGSNVGQAHLFVPEPSGIVLMIAAMSIAALFGRVRGGRRNRECGLSFNR